MAPPGRCSRWLFTFSRQKLPPYSYAHYKIRTAVAINSPTRWVAWYWRSVSVSYDLSQKGDQIKGEHFWVKNLTFAWLEVPRGKAGSSDLVSVRYKMVVHGQLILWCDDKGRLWEANKLLKWQLRTASSLPCLYEKPETVLFCFVFCGHQTVKGALPLALASVCHLPSVRALSLFCPSPTSCEGALQILRHYTTMTHHTGPGDMW